MHTTILHHHEHDEYWFHEGCHILEIANHADDPALSIARARVEPGITTQWHALHEVAERYLIIEGQGCVEIGELAPTTVVSGDVVCIPPGTRQRISNTGDGDLVFYAICTPRFTPACYRTLDTTE